MKKLEELTIDDISNYFDAVLVVKYKMGIITYRQLLETSKLFNAFAYAIKDEKELRNLQEAFKDIKFPKPIEL